MSPHQLAPGHQLYNRYSIQKVLGQGGFGITYLAYDQKLEQEVCIKELFVSGNSTRGANMTVQSQGNSAFSFAEFVDRFVQEAKQLARFQHPNIVRVIDIFQENDTAYTVMEFVNGETLKERVQRTGALEEKEAMLLINQLLGAVEVIHAKGMLHRDIKPENILISPEGRIVLIDFGSAREFAEDKASHQTVLITSGYAPPEQYSEHAKRGPFTDIYALGATLYYALTGQKPAASTERSLKELLAPQQLNFKLTNAISSTILKAMELKPDSRFQSIGEMREAINSSSVINLEKSSDATQIQEKTKLSPSIQKEKASPTLIQATPTKPGLVKEKVRSSNTQEPVIRPSSQKADKQPPAPKNRLALVFSLFFGALLLGGGIFWYQNSNESNEGSYYDPTTDSYGTMDEAPADSAAAVGSSTGNWSCGDGNYIDSAWLNDGDCDCYNCADEDNLVRCSNGDIINSAFMNDGDCDCYDCDDEVGLFRCANGAIINSAYLNDGDCDCGDTCDDEA
jgi:serine/threonine protein kinase